MKYKVGDKVKTIKEKDKYDIMLFPIGTVGVVTGINPNERDGLIYKVVEGIDGIDGYWWYSEDMLEPFYGKTYSDGLAEAWELARKICGYGEDTFDGSTLGNIFELESTGHIMTKNTYQQALAKIQEYESSKAIKIGDVVRRISDNKEYLIITEEEDDSVYKYGVIVLKSMIVDRITGDLLKFEKTGRHIDISILLEQIRGDE